MAQYKIPDFAEPKWPGDSALRTRFATLTEGKPDIGDVRIMDYGATCSTRFLVASFLPGVTMEYPGDTPKTEPEYSRWCATPEEAHAEFVRQVKLARDNGWLPMVDGCCSYPACACIVVTSTTNPTPVCKRGLPSRPDDAPLVGRSFDDRDRNPTRRPGSAP